MDTRKIFFANLFMTVMGLLFDKWRGRCFTCTARVHCGVRKGYTPGNSDNIAEGLSDDDTIFIRAVGAVIPGSSAAYGRVRLETAAFADRSASVRLKPCEKDSRGVQSSTRLAREISSTLTGRSNARAGSRWTRTGRPS